MEFLQPCPVFYDGPGGHLVVLSLSRSMIMGWPSRIASQRRSHWDQPALRSQTRPIVLAYEAMHAYVDNRLLIVPADPISCERLPTPVYGCLAG